MKTRKTFREIAQWIDDRPLEMKIKSIQYKMRQLSSQHRLDNSSDSKISFREIMERHNGGVDCKELSFLFYNTYLIHGLFGIAGAPFRSLRAELIGREIRNSGYDIAALCEVFDEKYQKPIKKQRFKYDAMGPVWTVGNTSSGLYTLSKFPLSFKRRRFEEKGYPPDSMSNKGVLLTTIDLGIGRIDLYSTHLFFGNSDVEATLPVKLRSKIQLTQLKELVEFIKESHNPKHVIIVAGDMNINPGLSHQNGGTYEKMMELFSNITLQNGSKISLQDLWKINGGKKGGTNIPTKGCSVDSRLTNPETGILYCNDDTNETNAAKNDEGRYDCIFVQKPSNSHEISVDFSRMKRRPFPFPDLTFNEVKGLLSHPLLIQDPRFMNKIRNKCQDQITEIVSKQIKKICNDHLSDHIGVDVKILINKKS